MCSLEKETEIKKVLRSLCMNNGWSFGVFWRFDHRNSMLLSLEDAYSEDYARSLTNNLLLEVHILGDGVIGQAALDGKHRWVLSDSSTTKSNFQQDNCSFASEFSSGIKTIVVIPVKSCGVLHLGSVHKILETPEFVDQTQRIFREQSLVDGLVPLCNSSSSSLISETIDQTDQFAHLVSSYNSIQSTNDSIPSSSGVNNQDYSSVGFNPLSFLGGSVDNQCLDSLLHGTSNLHGFDELNSNELPTIMDDNVLQWLYSLPAEQCLNSQDPTYNDDLLQSLLPSSNSDLTHLGNVKREETLEDILFAPMIDNKNDIITGAIKANSTMAVPKKGLFSELGLDQLLNNRADSSSFAKSSIEDPIHSSPKKRRMEFFQESGKSFIGDAKSCITDHTMRPQESSKATKKRARPGESPRPRPKDRQMIQDRIKELREIIPNGAKCSIDSLLDRTIKHMLFMQGVTKYVDKLKQVDEAKAHRDVSNNSKTSGSTAWAVEVGGHNPIIVEDLGHSGQMLIEMVCEDQGFFLEIADVIRGFGLTILKGVVEARDGKIWAQFIVEANRHVTRMEVLVSLLQIFKESSKSVLEGNNVLDNKNTSLLKNYHYNHSMIISILIPTNRDESSTVRMGTFASTSIRILLLFDLFEGLNG
ncbi:hypothetical protein V2J09_004875 [Rumex salicifolius]